MRACEELLKSSSAPRQSDSRNGNSSLEGKYYNRSSQMPFFYGCCYSLAHFRLLLFLLCGRCIALAERPPARPVSLVGVEPLKALENVLSASSRSLPCHSADVSESDYLVRGTFPTF